jgi:transcriptional regulator with XRE-family HTH domain
MNGDYFAGRLKELREHAKLTQKRLAERAGLTIRQVSRFETGEQKPSWETVLAIAAALNVKCTDFQQKPTKRKGSK